MVVHLIAEATVPGLIESFELVEIHREAVWHDEAVKDYGKARLAKGVHFLCFAENLGPCRNKQVLAVV